MRDAAVQRQQPTISPTHGAISTKYPLVTYVSGTCVDLYKVTVREVYTKAYRYSTFCRKMCVCGYLQYLQLKVTDIVYQLNNLQFRISFCISVSHRWPTHVSILVTFIQTEYPCFVGAVLNYQSVARNTDCFIDPLWMLCSVPSHVLSQVLSVIKLKVKVSP